MHFSYDVMDNGGVVLCGQSYDIAFLGDDFPFISAIRVDGTIAWIKKVEMTGKTLRTIGCPVLNYKANLLALDVATP